MDNYISNKLIITNSEFSNIYMENLSLFQIEVENINLNNLKFQNISCLNDGCTLNLKTTKIIQLKNSLFFNVTSE